MGEAQEKACERPLTLPDEVKDLLKEYWDNAARSFFPKPESICYEDIEKACLKYGILFFHLSGGEMRLIFSTSYGLGRDGQSRCLTVNSKYPEGAEL